MHPKAPESHTFPQRRRNPKIQQPHVPDGVLSDAEVFGHVNSTWPFAGAPLAGCLGDQHAAMLGQRCRMHEAKCTYGTGCFLLLHTGEELKISRHGLLTTVAFKLGPEKPVQYALEGSVAIAGAAVQWLRDSLGVIRETKEVEELAKTVDSTGGVYFVPAFRYVGMLSRRI